MLLSKLIITRVGTIFLRFENEAQANETLKWIKNTKKVQAVIKRVANSTGNYDPAIK